MTDSKLTVRDLLWDAGVSAGVAACISSAAKNVDRLSAVAGAPLQAVMNEAAEALSEALDISLGDILATAWTDSQKIREAADPAVHGPEEVILVPLAEHAIQSEHRPTLEFTIDGRSICSLEFVVELTLALQAVVLRIRAGRIRSVVAGYCHAAAALSCSGAELVRHETRNIALPVSVDFGEGIRVPARKAESEP